MGRRIDRMAHIRVLSGIVCISMGFGMMLVLIIPGWGFVVAALLMIIGFWNIYLCS